LRCVIEKFDRFLEYNSTTTQSDYGEQLDCLLDFLRLESEYERQAWNLTPIEIAHDVFSSAGRDQAAQSLEKRLAKKTSRVSTLLLKKLARLERQYSVRLPGVSSLLNERFVKPLALARILALVRPAMADARSDGSSQKFEALRQQIEEYLQSSLGSPLDMPSWLQAISDEVLASETDLRSLGTLRTPNAEVAPSLNPVDLSKQLEIWETPLDAPDRRL
jgi:hypothetical protein